LISKHYQPTLKLIASNPNSVSNTYQPFLKPSEVEQIDWIAFRLIDDIDWRWHQQDNIRFCGKDCHFKEGERVDYKYKNEMRLLLTEVKNDKEWKQRRQEPNARIESRYAFRCSYNYNNKLQHSYHLIEQSEFENNDLNQLISHYCYRWQDSVKKFELGIQVLPEKDYEEKFLNSYTVGLMVKRCFSIWSPIGRKGISRGLALTEMGQNYLDAQLAELEAQRVIKKADGKGWEVVEKQGLIPQPGQPLPQKGVEAAKKRAHQWQGTPLP
jgi:hypothetical protein